MAQAKTMSQEEMRTNVAISFRNFADQIERGEVLPISLTIDHEPHKDNPGLSIVELQFRKGEMK